MFIEQKKLPSIELVRELAPADQALLLQKKQFDEKLKQNFADRKRFVVVCGPCSADNPRSVNEYMAKLANLSSKCPELFIVARIYTAKPHSNGQGYRGGCFSIRYGDDEDLTEGIVRCRQMMINCIEMGLPVADELLYPELYGYFADLVSYWFIGARSSEDTLHRCLASGLDVCCGIKNGTDGDIYKAADSIYAASRSCVFPNNGAQIVTSGCAYAHIVLRGGRIDNNFIVNIDDGTVSNLKAILTTRGLNDFIMADLGHANSGKIAVNQIENANIVSRNSNINGVMLESYLYEGEKSTQYGVSQTDDCLSFADTVSVLLQLQREFINR